MTTSSDIERRLCGAWSLTSWRSILADGTERAPFGEDALGSLHYEKSAAGGGVMLAQLSMRKRPALDAANDAERAAAKCAAFDSYVAYGGHWRVQGERVIHQVTSSLFPNWVGTELVRTVAFIDEKLVLSTVPAKSNEVVHRLTWRRA